MKVTKRIWEVQKKQNIRKYIWKIKDEIDRSRKKIKMMMNGEKKMKKELLFW